MNWPRVMFNSLLVLPLPSLRSQTCAQNPQKKVAFEVAFLKAIEEGQGCFANTSRGPERLHELQYIQACKITEQQCNNKGMSNQPINTNGSVTIPLNSAGF